MAKCSVVLIYGMYPKPMPLGMTEDPRLKVLVKQQLLFEAEQKLAAVEGTDDILEISFRRNLEKMRETLDLIIPPELERVFNSKNGGDPADG